MVAILSLHVKLFLLFWCNALRTTQAHDPSHHVRHREGPSGRHMHAEAEAGTTARQDWDGHSHLGVWHSQQGLAAPGGHVHRLIVQGPKVHEVLVPLLCQQVRRDLHQQSLGSVPEQRPCNTTSEFTGSPCDLMPTMPPVPIVSRMSCRFTAMSAVSPFLEEMSLWPRSVVSQVGTTRSGCRRHAWCADCCPDPVVTFPCGAWQLAF